jgi:ABC-type dipeptide/oligopeptide/nickel transport system permease component
MRRHAFRNALPPALTHFGIRAAHLLAGAVIVEQIFGLPGLGQYAIQSVLNRDLGVLQAVVLLAATATVLVTITTDIAQAMLTPKVKLTS